jgi:rhamnosyltransferase
MASDADIIIFLTQDAFLADREALERLLRAFGDIEVGAAYGRQLPRAEAASVEAHARLFNYPQASRIKTAFDIPQLGIKTAFLSNSFAAYRRAALIEVGGFPDDVIVSEDLYVASKMILSGWKIAYCADACVFHSHDYGIFQEFRRYFDIGVFHGSESWIRRKFGLAEGEGKRFFLSEFRYVVKKGEIYLILPTLTRNLLKYFGYHLGMNYRRLPLTLAQRLSMNKKWWDKRR